MLCDALNWRGTCGNSRARKDPKATPLGSFSSEDPKDSTIEGSFILRVTGASP